MPLEYSDRAMIGYAELYKSINQRTIFIEDANGRRIYERLLAELVGPGAVKRVFPLSGRDAVLKDWRKNKESKEYIYIIDGDLNLTYQRCLSRQNLVQLDAYCIENIVADPMAIAEVLMDFCDDRVAEDEVEPPVRELITEVASAFAPLYVLFGIAHRLKFGQVTSGESGARFFNRDGIKRRELIKRTLQFARSLRAQYGLARLRKERAHIESVLLGTGLKPAQFASGKSAILPIVHKYCEWTFGYVGSREVLLNQASRYSKIDPQSRLGKQLLALFS